MDTDGKQQRKVSRDKRKTGSGIETVYNAAKT
jgi:hypothetical protein